MNKINDSTNKSGLISLIGSLIVLFSYMLPVNDPFIDTPYIWIWGLSYWRAEYYFLLHDLFTQISLVFSGLILCCVLVVIIISNKLRKGEPFKPSGVILIGLALTILVVIFFWAMTAHYMLEYVVEEVQTLEGGIEVKVKYTKYFWEYNAPGLGLVGLILGAIVILYGGIVAASSK